LAALGKIAAPGGRRIEAGEQPREGAGANPVGAKRPDRLGVRNRVEQRQPGKAHERKLVAQMGVIGQRVQRRQHQDAEHLQRVVSRASPRRCDQAPR
jgi:hypothetical protein